MPEVAINPVLAALSVSLSLLLKCQKMYKININFILYIIIILFLAVKTAHYTPDYL